MHPLYSREFEQYPYACMCIHNVYITPTLMYAHLALVVVRLAAVTPAGWAKVGQRRRRHHWVLAEPPALIGFLRSLQRFVSAGG